jgi:diacylglycerol O-acyltransferase
MIRLEGPDAAFIYGETPEWHFHVSGVMLLDPSAGEGWSPERLRETLASRIHQIPQFRWKLHTDPTAMSRPIMADDPDFDIAHHVEVMTLPSPADERTLTAAIGKIIEAKIDRDRPLWTATVIEGLEDGRVAVVMKIHHAIIDGASGVDLLPKLMDLEPRPEPDPKPPPYEPRPLPSHWARAYDGIGQVLAYPRRFGRLAWQLVGQGRVLVGSMMADVAPPNPFTAPPTPFNGPLTARRTVAWASVPMAEVTAVKEKFGVKANDVVLAIVSGALRRYLADLEALPDKSLVAQVPVSLRTDASRDRVGTQVGAMFTSLASDEADPSLRLRRIAAESSNAKAMRRELDVHRLENITATVTPALISLAAKAWTAAELDRRTPPVFNLIVSNVAGPPVDLYMAGARIVAMYPFGPLLYGTGINVTVVSNADRLDVGFLACPDLAADIWALADQVVPAFEELRA